MADYIPEEILLDVLRFMRPVNRLALEMEMRYGMRIGDLLSQEWAGGWSAVLAGDINYVDYKEQKTGKMRRIWPVKYDLLCLKEIKRGDNPFCSRPGRARATGPARPFGKTCTKWQGFTG